MLGRDFGGFTGDTGEIQLWCQIASEGDSITSFLQVYHSSLVRGRVPWTFDSPEEEAGLSQCRRGLTAKSLEPSYI